MQIDEQHTREVKTSKVPLQAGVLVSTSTRGSMTITFGGIIVVGNPQDAGRTGAATGMVTNIITEKSLMEAWLLESDEPFTFYRYITGAKIYSGGNAVEYNAGAKTRFYKDVFCTALNFSFTNKSREILPYSFTLLVPDGVEWRKTS